MFELATPPPADEPKVFAVCSENRVIDHPAPLPATLRRGTLVVGMTPDRDEYLQAQAPQSFEPGAFGQSTQQPRGDVLVPSAYAGELIPRSAAKQGGKHDPDDFAHELLLRLQAAFDLRHQGIGEA